MQARPPSDSLCDGIAFIDKNARSPRILSLLRHWRDACQGRVMPAWADIDPTEMPSALPNIWAWSYDRRSGEFLGRIAGEAIRSIFRRPIAGVSMRDYFQAWNYDRIVQRYKRAVATPAIGFERGIVFQLEEHYAIGARIILPLASDGLHCDGVVGVTTYDLYPTRLADSRIRVTSRPDAGISAGDCLESYFPLIGAVTPERMSRPSSVAV